MQRFRQYRAGTAYKSALVLFTTGNTGENEYPLQAQQWEWVGKTGFPSLLLYDQRKTVMSTRYVFQ